MITDPRTNPAKRRRTSHTTALRIAAPATPSPPPRRQDGIRTSPRRTSFRSPTKASLARMHADATSTMTTTTTTTRPRSAGSGSPQLRVLGDGDNRAARPSAFLMSPPKSSTSGASQKGGGVGTALGSQAMKTSGLANLIPGHAPWQERTPEPSMDVASSQFTTAAAAGVGSTMHGQTRAQQLLYNALAAEPHPDMQVAPVALMKPSAPSMLDSVLRRRSARFSEEKTMRSLLSAAVDESMDGPVATDDDQPIATDDDEPELPPTPMELEEEDATTVRDGSDGMDNAVNGEHRRKARWERKAASSMLSTDPAPVSPVEEEEQETVEEQAEKEDVTMAKPALEMADGEDATRADPASFLRDTKAQLLSELHQLEREVEVLKQALDQAGRLPATVSPTPREAPDAADDQAGFVGSLPPAHIAMHDGAARLSWGVLLPFCKRRRAPGPAATRALLPIPDHAPPSHHPIELAHPLPYLQAFTRLTFTWIATSSHVEPGRGGGRHGRTRLDEHTMRATAPHQLLSATIHLAVDRRTHAIARLTLPSLSAWAEPELGRWARARAQDDSVAGKDIASVCWALGRYWELAEKRARFWLRCERCFPLLATTHAGSRLPLSLSSPSSPSQPLPLPPPPPAHDEPSSSDRLQLSRHLGRAHFLFRHQGVQLLVGWQITFDWTGQAQSQVSATASVPDGWTQADSRASLAQTSPLFRQLVREKGMFGATAVLLRLLFPAREAGASLA
ncbi:MAG: hypothetical protein M1826_006134 [Phylliscum demangeonii]|nr:MAG: hypothetical protein M1826_006134 [Phylliscum demangeonii]